jgi:hypothetical protein
MLSNVKLIRLSPEVYALYNRSKRIAIVLVSLVVAEVSVSSVNSYINLPKLQFNSACLTQLALRPVIQFGFVIPFPSSKVSSLTAVHQHYSTVYSKHDSVSDFRQTNFRGACRVGKDPACVFDDTRWCLCVCGDIQ